MDEKAIIKRLREKLNRRQQMVDKMIHESIGWKRRMNEQSGIIERLKSKLKRLKVMEDIKNEV